MLFPLWFFLMLVGSVAADTKATKELLMHSTTTQSLYLGAIAAILAALAACIIGH